MCQSREVHGTLFCSSLVQDLADCRRDRDHVSCVNQHYIKLAVLLGMVYNII